MSQKSREDETDALPPAPRDRGFPSRMHALDDLLENGIKLHADEIARAWRRGAVAVVVYRPSSLVENVARALGWNGAAPVFSLPTR